MSKKEQIIEEIRKIYDPELPVNIYELGLIYDIKVEDEKFAKIISGNVFHSKYNVILYLKNVLKCYPKLYILSGALN